MSWKSTVLGATCALAFSTAAALADSDGTVVAVSLWDKGEASLDNAGMVPGLMMSEHGDMSLATTGVTLSVTTVAAGEVTFNVTNDSDSIIHELLVIPVASTDTPMPYDEVSMRIDEDAAGALGEVPELEPGQTGSASFRLEPGQYLLVCNVAGHYPMGMWAILTVE
jgi:uncharacterized cupredoxin-like copper-binding protein